MDRSDVDELFARMGALDAEGVAARFAADGVLAIAGAPSVRGQVAVGRALRDFLGPLEGLSTRTAGLWEIPGGFVREAEARYRVGGEEVALPEVAVVRGDAVVRELRLYHDPAPLAAALRAARGPTRPDLQVRHEQRGVQGSFFVLHDGRRVGELTYTVAGPKLMVIDHTEVGPELRGRGAGQRLVEASVAWARSTGRRVLPLCPFARATLARSRELQDVMAPH